MGNAARTLGLAFVFAIAILGPIEARSEALPAPAPAAAACTPADQCCMICDKGQACGNSCISRKKTCHKGRGCSCNASEVCADS